MYSNYRGGTKKAEGSFKVNETAELEEVKVGERVLPNAAMHWTAIPYRKQMQQ